MDYFVTFFLGMATSMLILRWALSRTIDQILKKIDQAVDAEETTDGPKLKLEFDQNTYFTYNTANNQFVCQGTSIQQLRERLSEMFPGQTATIVEGDPVLLASIQQELEQTK
jgi:hypothetical protein